MERLTARPSFEHLQTLQVAILFKHSERCLISYLAYRQVAQFQVACPDLPIFMLLVQESPELSRHVAVCTGVQHASPQILILRHGIVTASASHHNITADWLEEKVSCV